MIWEMMCGKMRRIFSEMIHVNVYILYSTVSAAYCAVSAKGDASIDYRCESNCGLR